MCVNLGYFRVAGMKIIKHINNNFAIAVDHDGNELIVSGKGIGFGDLPREVEDLGTINRSYYNIDPKYYSMLNTIPEEIIEIAISRFKNHMKMSLPILHDVENFYEIEMEIGKYTLKLIRDNLKIYLPREEAAYIALHFVNAEMQVRSSYVSDEHLTES